MFKAKLVINDKEVVLDIEHLENILSFCMIDLQNRQDIIEEFAKCPSARVRAEVAGMKGLSPEVVHQLAYDKNYMVISNLIKNSEACPHIPASRINDLITSDDTEILLSIFENLVYMTDIYPDDISLQMAAHKDPILRLSAARSLDAPRGLLMELVHDEDSGVSNAAQVSLEYLDTQASSEE